MPTGRTDPQQDPVEGAPDIIEHELKRQDKAGSGDRQKPPSQSDKPAARQPEPKR